jgi:superfamily II DNA or RNA helicase
MIEGNKAKGDSFEKLALAYFRTDPKFQNIKNVWHQREIPYDVRSNLGLPTNDLGIDILLESVDGDYYPVQCKFHSDPNRAVGWKEASTFIGILNSNENFKAGYLSSNAFEVSSNYDKAISGKPIVRLLGSIWDNVDPDPTAKTREALVPLTPRPHQERAISDAIEYFVKEDNSRGKLIFPCGAGKSLTAFWITQELGARSVLVAVPSLALVKQTLEVYLREIAATQKTARWLCVCSDQEIGSADEVKIHTSDLGVPCTTDPTEIRNWLQRPGEQQQIVFTTYQSGQLLADIAREENIAFDLAILDEAHKTVGSTGKLFSYLLFDENIDIRKRIFMTATERFYSGTKDDIVSMDDPDVYGEVFTQMTFKEAIEQQLLTDYKVITIDVAKKEIADFIRENKLIELDSKWGKETEARSLAAMIALRKAMKALPIRNAVSFHSSIAKAERNDKLQKHITEAYKLPAIASYTVSGKMSTGQRDRIVNEFASKKGALITNARCLTEGVDVPNIDCIVFADPRKSRIDIVQALGRALRRKEGKDWGYVILPVVYDGDTHEIDNDNFQEIVSIIRGLAANDERIAEYFKDKQSIEKTGGVQLTNVQLEFLTEILEESQFQSQLEIKLWEGLSRFNWMSFEEAREYVSRLELKNVKEWILYSKSNDKPSRIPSNPQLTYKNSWLSWGDFLGTGAIAMSKISYLNFEKAKKYVHTLGLLSQNEWYTHWEKNIQAQGIPKYPDGSYKNKGWKNWGDFLGTNRVAYRSIKYLPYEKARDFIRKLKLKNTSEWGEYCKLGNKPIDIPSNPQNTYKNKGWVSYGEWLGTFTIASQNRKYLEYNKAKKYVQNLNLRNKKEWLAFCSSVSMPSYLPSKPDRVYSKTNEWVSFSDWLGTELTSDVVFLPFQEAREFVHKLGLQNGKQWLDYCKSGSKPSYIPSNPDKSYKKMGWINISDWLNAKNRSPHREFLTFEELKSYVKKLNIKSTSEWKEFCSSEQHNSKIPKAPDQYYKEWTSWGDFLGTGYEINREFLSYEEAKVIVHSFGLKGQKDWKNFSKSSRRPRNIPGNPYKVYSKSNEWRSFGDWLGTGVIAASNIQFADFNTSKIHAINLKLNSVKEWLEYSKSGKRPTNIPSNPQNTYKLSGWTNWPDFLGYDKKK